MCLAARRCGTLPRRRCRRASSKKALAAVVDGRMVDLSYPLDADATLRLVMPSDADALPL